jgi:hypothetical protein
MYVLLVGFEKKKKTTTQWLHMTTTTTTTKNTIGMHFYFLVRRAAVSVVRDGCFCIAIKTHF